MRRLKSISELKLGDTIRHINESQSKQVIYHGGQYVLAARTIHISNPDEWLVLDNQAQAPNGPTISFELMVSIVNLIKAKYQVSTTSQQFRSMLEETIEIALGSADHVS